MWQVTKSISILRSFSIFRFASFRFSFLLNLNLCIHVSKCSCFQFSECNMKFGSGSVLPPLMPIFNFNSCSFRFLFLPSFASDSQFKEIYRQIDWYSRNPNVHYRFCTFCPLFFLSEYKPREIKHSLNGIDFQDGEWKNYNIMLKKKQINNYKTFN